MIYIHISKQRCFFSALNKNNTSLTTRNFSHAYFQRKICHNQLNKLFCYVNSHFCFWSKKYVCVATNQQNLFYFLREKSYFCYFRGLIFQPVVLSFYFKLIYEYCFMNGQAGQLLHKESYHKLLSNKYYCTNTKK